MKTLLISGASKGIGKAIAIAAAQEGYNLVLNYNKSENEAKKLESELAKITGVISVKADVGQINEVNAMIDVVHKRFGAITHLVNNAGVSWSGLLTEMSSCQCDRVIDTNLKGVINLTKAVIPDMIDKKYGAIVNISSIWGKTGASCEAVYSATKSAIISFGEAMARELGLSGIRVNTVCPGVIETDMLSNLTTEDKRILADNTALGRLGKPADVANAVLFLLSDKSSYITAQSFAVDGGFI